MPSWGFSLAVSGRTIPLLVLSSFSTGLTTTRSPNGFRFMCSPPQLFDWVGSPHARALSTRVGRLLIVIPAGAGCQTCPCRALPHESGESLGRLGRGFLGFLDQ